MHRNARGRFCGRVRGGTRLYTLATETPDDWWEVEALYDTCFAPGRQALSSYRLRDDVPPVAELCRVAKDETGRIGGAIRYWPVLVGGKRALRPRMAVTQWRATKPLEPAQ